MAKMRPGPKMKKVTKMRPMISGWTGIITQIRPEMTLISKIKFFLTKQIFILKIISLRST